MDKRQKGIYHKYFLSRTDGTDAPGQKHESCDYYVLDLTHDPYARPAIIAYGSACAIEFPQLSADLLAKAEHVPTTIVSEAAEKRQSATAGYIAGLSVAADILERDAAKKWDVFNTSTNSDVMSANGNAAATLDIAAAKIRSEVTSMVTDVNNYCLLDVIEKQRHQIDELKKLILSPADLDDDIIDAPRSFLQLICQTSIDYGQARDHLEMSGKEWPALAPDEKSGHITKAGVAIVVYRAMEQERMRQLIEAVNTICK